MHAQLINYVKGILPNALRLTFDWPISSHVEFSTVPALLPLFNSDEPVLTLKQERNRWGRKKKSNVLFLSETFNN